MFGKINYLTITIYILGGALILSILVLISYRFLTRKKIVKSPNDQLGKVNNQFNDLIKLLATTTNFEIIHNILIKNKYAKKNYSLIPAIIFCQNNLFLLTNLINLTKIKEATFTMDYQYTLINKKNKVIKQEDLNLNSLKEISKFLKHNFNVGKIHFVIPCLNGQGKINNQSNLSIIDVFDFAEKLNVLSRKTEALKLLTIKKIAQKLAKNNLFKAKIAITNNYVKKATTNA